jgi:asparagine synthetase B (glutamine-hydrolysing)
MAVGSNQLLLKKTLIAGNVLSDSKDKERCGREERADSFFWKDHIDPKGVDHFLAYNYLPGRKTFFKGINALRGGEAFEFKANDNISYMFAHKGLFPYFEVENKLACTYFYILPCFTEPDHSPFDSASESSSESSSKPSPARLSKSFPNLSSESVSEALAESLAKAADRILKACVCSGCALKEEKNPVQNSDIRAGMLLSGGVDSSFVALSIKNGYQNKKIPCRMESALSIDFSYENYSEKEKFQPVAQKLNLSLIKKTLAPNVLSYLPLIHSKLGWPAADASFMGLYVSGRSASDMGYHALYTGDGGDEIFGGYLRHDIVRKDVDAENCKSFEECKSMDAYIRELSLFDLSERQELYSREFLKDLDNSPEDMNVIHESLEMGKTRTRDIRDLTCFLDLVTLLPGNNCPKTTVMLGMNKVIPVSPMLDKEWAFKAMSYPVHTRFSPDYSKAVLRDYLTKEFPENISMAPKRMLTLPVGEWYSHQLRRRLMKLSEKDLLIEKHYIKKGSFKRILGNHFKTKETRRLRALIAFESFLLFLDTGKGLTW